MLHQTVPVFNSTFCKKIIRSDVGLYNNKKTFKKKTNVRADPFINSFSSRYVIKLEQMRLQMGSRLNSKQNDLEFSFLLKKLGLRYPPGLFDDFWFVIPSFTVVCICL